MTSQVLEEEFAARLTEAYVAAFGKAPTEAWIDAISLRAGLHGQLATLDEAATLIGVTRERVRQVFDRITPYLAGAPLTTAVRVVETLDEHSPVREPIGELLSRLGLSRASLTGPALLRMLDLTGTRMKDVIGTELVAVDDWLVEESEVPVMKAVSVARKHTSKFGLTTVEEIRQAMTTDVLNIDPEDVQRVLTAEPTVRWSNEWLWVEKSNDGLHSNRLINTARAILSVNSPQSVESIHEGARRLWKFRHLDVLAPVSAMRDFFSTSPHFSVQDDLVGLPEPLDYHEILGPTTAAMIDILKTTPYQVMDRQSLYEACDDAGIAPGTYGIWTTYAEWMEGFGRNVWGLRGSSPNPAAVETIRKVARARSQAEPRRKAWSWDADGRVVQTMDVTTSLLGSGVLSFEPAIHNLLSGQSIAASVDGTRIAMAKLGADHSFSWGWHPVLKALDLKQGDVIQIAIDLAARSATVRKGDQSLW